MDTARQPQTKTVGIIDDDIVYIRAVERMLRLGHLEALPITTLDAEEAARVAAEARCSAVLIDVMMYGMPLGFSYIDRLRALKATADVPLVVASGAKGQLEGVAAFLSANRCVRLDKPFGPDELLMAIANVLADPPQSTIPVPRALTPSAERMGSPVVLYGSSTRRLLQRAGRLPGIAGAIFTRSW